jgi:DNA-binding IclR family transcriptional regulator
MTVLEVLREGRASALTKREIARRCGIPMRHVEREIEKLRKSGRAGICSDSEVGYWLPTSVTELAENVDRRRRRALVQLVTVRGEMSVVRRWRGEPPKPVEPVQEALW